MHDRAVLLLVLIVLASGVVLGAAPARAEPSPEADAATQAGSKEAPGPAGGSGPASAPADEPTAPMDEIVVRAARIDRPVSRIPAGVGVVEKDDIQLARQRLTLGESLAGVPGVFTQNRQNFAQDLRIAVRGFGARARFGIRGIKLLIDGIPATLPDGQGQVDTLQLATAGRIEVVRGPSATLYGSAAGGVILVETEDAPAVPDLSGRFALGQNGYQAYDLKGGGRSGSVGLLAGLSRQVMGGYREQSHMETNVFNGKVDWEIDGRQTLSGVARFVYSPIADDPGGLTAEEKSADRRQAAPRNLLLDVGERVGQATTGLRYRLTSGRHHETTASAWFGYRQFSSRLPFDAQCREDGPVPGGATVDLDRYFGGGSLQHVWSRPMGRLHNDLLAGIDVEVQSDDRARRCLYETFQGRPTLQQDETVTGVRGFVRDALQLPADLELVAGVGFDALFYRVTDHLPAIPGDPDDSGGRDFTEWSPMAAMTWRPAPALSAWWRISTSFEPPTTTELRLPVGGGFDPFLQPQRAVNFELGARGRVRERLRYELVVYYLMTRDELVPVDVFGDTFFRNAGRTWRTGVELGLSYEIVSGLIARGAYTFTTARFDQHATVEGTWLGGNEIPGVPEHLLDLSLEWRHASGLFAALEGRYVGAFYADDLNTVESDAYGVVDARLGWEIRLGRFALTPMVGLNNLANELYDDNIRLNAAGGRYYEPAPEIEVYGGATLAWRFGD